MVPALRRQVDVYDPGLGAQVPGACRTVGAPIPWSGPPVNRWVLGGYEPGKQDVPADGGHRRRLETATAVARK